MIHFSRRDFLATTFAGAASLSLSPAFGESISSKSEAFVPIRQITKGPKHHWFGYYDKLEFDPDNRYVLSNEVQFEHRSPSAKDSIKVGMVDTQNSDQWIEIGSSNAWGWQQGCMLQWRPKHGHEVVWNDREGDRYVCHVRNVKTGEQRTLPKPVYTLSPDGKWAVTADFSRINNLRPGYGYHGVPDANVDVKAPEDSGIWRMNMDTGETELIVSLAEISQIPYKGKTTEKAWNYFNHLLVSPDGQRFIFLHRWREQWAPSATGKGWSRFMTRMFTANMDGTDRYVLDPSGYTSHFIWRDPNHICAWTKPNGKPSKFYLFEDQTENVEVVGPDKMPVNGHNTYVPQTNGEWILTDTYPQGKLRHQIPYLYHVPSGKRVELGRFHLPSAYKGEWRCDLHPRCSNDGMTVAIDSPHGGNGRQVWLLDISQIIKG